MSTTVGASTTLYLRPGNNAVSFVYDKALDRLTATIRSITLEYTNVSTRTVGSSNVCRMNVMNILLRNSTSTPPTGTVSFNNVTLNGVPIGPFSIPANGIANWNITNVDFSDGFSLQGVIVLDGGTYANSES